MLSQAVLYDILAETPVKSHSKFLSSFTFLQYVKATGCKNAFYSEYV